MSTTWNDIPTKTIKAADELFTYLKEETVDDINDSVKNISKKIRAGFYLSISTIFLIIGKFFLDTSSINCAFLIFRRK